MKPLGVRLPLTGVLAGLVIMLVVSVTQAAPVTFIYEGEVTQVAHSSLIPPVLDKFLGETMRMEYTFESTTTGSGLDGGSYFNAISDLTVTLGANVYHNTLPVNIYVANDLSFGDRYYTDLHIPMTGPAIDGIDPRSFQFRFQDSTATALSSNALPDTILDPAAFDTVYMFLDFLSHSSSGFLTVAGPNSVRAVVPVPSAMWLMGTGLAALVGWRWRTAKVV